jgi:cytochrome c oxidase subunit 2
MNQGFRFTLDQASKQAWEVDALYYFLWLVTAFFTVLIFLLIAFLTIRYRRRSEDEKPHPTIESKWLEMTYTFIPFGIVMVIFFWGLRTYFSVYGRTEDNALNIHVVGKQWMWKLQHPDGKREINELHLPVNQPVTITLASQDVIHSFFVPAFRAKMDAVPGRYTKMSFTPSKVGEYHLFCAEYCGAEHSRMGGRVVVMEEQQYQDWLKGTPADAAPAAAGQKLFVSRGCLTCHGQVAPTMAGLYGKQDHEVMIPGSAGTVKVKVDDAYLRESILNSTAKLTPGYGPLMPSYRNQLTEEELMDLIAYIKSLKDVSAVQSGTVRSAQDQREPTPVVPRE